MCVSLYFLVEYYLLVLLALFLCQKPTSLVEGLASNLIKVSTVVEGTKVAVIAKRNIRIKNKSSTVIANSLIMPNKKNKCVSVNDSEIFR